MIALIFDFTSALRSLKEHFTVRTRLSNSADSDFVNIRTLMTDHGGKSSEIWPLMSHLVSSSLTVSSILWRVGILRIFDCCATYHSSQSINTLWQHAILRRYGAWAYWSLKLSMPARESLEKCSLPSSAMCTILTCMLLEWECQLIDDGMHVIPLTFRLKHPQSRRLRVRCSRIDKVVSLGHKSDMVMILPPGTRHAVNDCSFWIRCDKACFHPGTITGGIILMLLRVYNYAWAAKGNIWRSSELTFDAGCPVS